MSVIVNSAWKGKKNGDTVSFKNKEYTIGSDAYASVEAAAADDKTADLVIVDKKLTTPVKGKSIESAATDIFEANVKEDVSKDNKTSTKTVKFTAAAGGTATTKNDIELEGFEKVSVTDAGGFFLGGKQDLSYSGKVVNDTDKEIFTNDTSANYTTTATGSLTVNNKEAAVVAVGGIADASGDSAIVFDELKDTYSDIIETEEELDIDPAASYANVTLKNAVVEGTLNGGSVTQKSTMKYSETADTRSSGTYTYSASTKTGAGTANLTDSSAGDIIGYKTVQITNKNVDGDLEVGAITAGSENENRSRQKSYVADASFNDNSSYNLSDSVGGTFTLTGKDGQNVVTGDIQNFSNATLKFVRVADAGEDEIEAWAGSEQDSQVFSANKKGNDVALTYSDSYKENRTAQGVLTVRDSSVGRLEGLKTLTLTDTKFTSADSMNYTEVYNRKQTGFADDLTDDMSIYDDLDGSLSQTNETSYKKTWTSAGTATMTDADASGASVDGFKAVTINRKDSESASAYGNITAGNKTRDYSSKMTYDVDKSTSNEESEKTTYTAAGNLTATGNKTNKAETGDIKRFSSVTLKYATVGAVGMTDYNSDTSRWKLTVKAQGDDNAFSNTHNQDTNKTAGGTLTANDSTINGSIDMVKTVSLTNSKFSTAVATNYKNTSSGSSDGFTNDDIAPYTTAVSWDLDKKHSSQSTSRTEYSVGGASFKFAGKTVGEGNNAYIEGYKSVSLDNKNSEETGVLTASLKNVTETTETTSRSSLDPDKSYSDSYKSVYNEKSMGDATIKGYTSAGVEGFASVKATGSNYETKLTGFSGTPTVNEVENMNQTGKAAQNTNKDEYSYSMTESRKITSTLDASKAELSGDYEDLKTVKLQNVKLSGAGFYNETDKNKTVTKNVKWDGDSLTESTPVADKSDWVYGDPSAFENVTSASFVKNKQKTAVGDFTLSNDQNSTIEDGLYIDGFKNVTITLAGTDTIETSMFTEYDETEKESFRYTANATKKTLDYSESETETTVGALKVTGKSTASAVTTLEVDGADLDFASITLKDAAIVGGAEAYAYVEKSNFTVSQSSSEDGSASVKASRSSSETGNGKFSASVAKPVEDTPVMVFEGALFGYGSISLNNVSIGNANNFKRVGSEEGYYVPVSGEYFDVYGYNTDEPEEVPEGSYVLYGDFSGSYTVDKKGEINSNWKSSSSEKASGSFTQTAKNAGAMAGGIYGYDKVSLTGVKYAGDISGLSWEDSKVVTYKTANGEAVTDTMSWTCTGTSGASVELTGKKIDSVMQTVEAGNIDGYKTVTLDNALVGYVAARSYKYAAASDGVKKTSTYQDTTNAIGTLTAKESTIGGEAVAVTGFKTVTLTDTDAETADFNGVSYARTDFTENWGTEDAKTTVTSYESKSAGSFSAQYTGKDSEADFKVGNVTGYQQVKLADYSAGNVAAGEALSEEVSYVNSWKVTLGNDAKGTPDTIKASVATKSNTLTATAKVNENMTLGDVQYYGKVEASGLTAIGSVSNAWQADQVEFFKRKYSNVHYGEGSAAATRDENDKTVITALNVDASSASVTVKGVAAKKDQEARFTAAGSVQGYGSVNMSYVSFAAEEEAVTAFTGGNYSYTSKTSKAGEVTATSASTAAGKLVIESAKADDGALFAVEGFKDVKIDITEEGTGAAVFTDIIGGDETANLIDGELEYKTYAVAGSLELATAGGAVDYVGGFQSVSLQDTNVIGNVSGYAIEAKNVDGAWEQEFVAKSSITFENTKDFGASNTIASVSNAKSVTFKAESDEDLDFQIDSISSEENDDLTVLIEKCQTSMDAQKLTMNEGDKINLTSSGVLGDGTWATIEFQNLTGDTLETYFDSMIGSQISGKGTIIASVSEDDFKLAVKDKVEIGSNITYQQVV